MPILLCLAASRLRAKPFVCIGVHSWFTSAMTGGLLLNILREEQVGDLSRSIDIRVA
jgi:hypothetical protein